MPTDETKTAVRRDVQLDRLKGIGIILVIFAHICVTKASILVFLFHMPLFFFLSGAGLSYSSELTFKPWKRFKRLMVPYFGFSILCFAYWFFIEYRFRPLHDVSIFPGFLGSLGFKWQQLVNIPLAFSYNEAFQYNVVLWFLPCLFVAVMLFIALRKLLGRYSFIGAWAAGALGFLLLGVHLPWCLEIALVAVPFVWAGFDLYRHLKSASYWIAAGILAVSVALIWYFNPNVDMRTHTYGNVFLFYAVALGLVAVLVIASRCLVHLRLGGLDWLGRNSLTLMCLHGPVYRVVLAVLSKVLHIEMATLRGSELWSLCVTILVIGLLIPVILGLNKYLPVLVGREKART